MSENLTQLVEQISSLSLLETSNLVKMLEEKLGVSAAAPVAVAAAAPASGAPAASAKSEFDIILVSAGDKKINVIKEVRAITGLGLVEAKALVDTPSSAILKAAKQSDADDAKKKLEAAGAKVELK